MHLELRREHREDEMEMGKSKVYYRVVNKIMCSVVEGGYTFEGSEKENYVGISMVISLDAQEQWIGFAHGKVKSFF